MLHMQELQHGMDHTYIGVTWVHSIRQFQEDLPRSMEVNDLMSTR